MSEKPNIVVFTGSGVSAESGLLTFRDAGGLWENYDVMEVASIDGWHRNPSLVLDFYNKRRIQAYSAVPNEGHLAIARIQSYFNASIITQNVDGLHEKAGSYDVLHLHGELSKVRSTIDDEYIIDIGDKTIQIGDQCPKGGQLRPHIVWFGEQVSSIYTAEEICSKADILVIAGTSLEVYPAAGLVHSLPEQAEIFVVDPNTPELYSSNPVSIIREKASTGLPKVEQTLKERYLQDE
jgi:NAD-dependent deacetylase